MDVTVHLPLSEMKLPTKTGLSTSTRKPVMKTPAERSVRPHSPPGQTVQPAMPARPYTHVSHINGLLHLCCVQAPSEDPEKTKAGVKRPSKGPKSGSKSKKSKAATKVSQPTITITIRRQPYPTLPPLRVQSALT
jgi:hypothetical protein